MLGRFRKQLRSWGHPNSVNRARHSTGVASRRLRLERLESREVLATLQTLPLVVNPNFVVQSQDQLTLDQRDAQVAMAPDGGSYVVAWQDEKQSGVATEVHFQRFNTSGVPLFAEQVIATSSSRLDQQDMRIAIADNGTFVMTWEATINAANGQQDVFFQRFGPDGTPLTPILLVAGPTGSDSNPDVYYAPDALSAVVVWQHFDSTTVTTSSTLQFRHIDFSDAGGSGLTGRALVTVTDTAHLNNVPLNVLPRIAGRKSGTPDSFAITWVGAPPAPSTHTEVYYRLYDSQDNALTPISAIVPQDLTAYPRLNESRGVPSIGMDAAGEFVIAFSETVDLSGQPLDHDLYLARFQPNGSPTSQNPIVGIDVDGTSGNGTARHDALKNAVSMTAAGQTAVVWELDGSYLGNASDVSTYLLVQVLLKNGLPGVSGAPTPIDTSNIQPSGLPGVQDNPEVHISPDGNHMIVGWASDVNRRTNSPAASGPRPQGDQDIVLQAYQVTGLSSDTSAFRVGDSSSGSSDGTSDSSGTSGNSGSARTISTSARSSPIDSAIVASMYQLGLGRDADAGGLAYWGSQLLVTMSRQQVGLSLLQSEEFRSHAIDEIYQTLLGRSSDVAARGYWLGQLAAGQSLQYVIAQIVGSTEYLSLAGGSNDEFITALYQNLLNRAPDASGVGWWNAQLAAGTDRATIASQVLSSAEATNIQVNNLYTNLLGRAADASGLAYWSARLRNGARYEDVVAAIFGSGEFLSQLQTYLAQIVVTNDANSNASSFLTSNGRAGWNLIRGIV